MGFYLKPLNSMALLIVQQIHQLVIPCEHISKGPEDQRGPASFDLVSGYLNLDYLSVL